MTRNRITLGMLTTILLAIGVGLLRFGFFDIEDVFSDKEVIFIALLIFASGFYTSTITSIVYGKLDHLLPSNEGGSIMPKPGDVVWIDGWDGVIGVFFKQEGNRLTLKWPTDNFWGPSRT